MNSHLERLLVELGKHFGKTTRWRALCKEQKVKTDVAKIELAERVLAEWSTGTVAELSSHRARLNGAKSIIVDDFLGRSSKPKDVDEQATKLASDAQLALEEGDLSRAQQLFREAGNNLINKLSGISKPSERDSCRFRAATYYFNGGLYAEALKLSDKVELSRLPRRLRSSFTTFKRGVKERTTEGYKQRMLKRLMSEYKDATDNSNKSAFENVIAILKEIGFLLPADQVAYVRGRCSAGLGLNRAASLFFRKAYSLNKRPNYRTVYLDSLYRDGRLKEAQNLIDEEMAKGEDFNLVIDSMFVRSRQATNRALGREDWCRDEIILFEKAWKLYTAHPSEGQASRRSRMNLAFSLALIAFDELEDVEGKSQLLHRWVAFDSGKAQLVLRGLHTYPNPQAIDDFRRVIRSETEEPLPYIFLAHHGYVSHQYTDCIGFADKALARHLSPEPKSFVLEMLAAAQKKSGTFDHSRIAASLRQAAEVKSMIGEESVQFTDESDVEPYLESDRFQTGLSLEQLSSRCRRDIRQYEEEIQMKFARSALEVSLVS